MEMAEWKPVHNTWLELSQVLWKLNDQFTENIPRLLADECINFIRCENKYKS